MLNPNQGMERWILIWKEARPEFCHEALFMCAHANAKHILLGCQQSPDFCPTLVNLVDNISSKIRRAAQRSMFAGPNITPSFSLSILVPVFSLYLMSLHWLFLHHQKHE